VKSCDDCPELDVKELARTVTTLVLAVASMIVMTLAGCANPRGIESKAALAAPTALGAVDTTVVALVAADCGEASTTRCSPT